MNFYGYEEERMGRTKPKTEIPVELERKNRKQGKKSKKNKAKER